MEKLSSRKDARRGSTTKSFSLKLRLEPIALGIIGPAATGREEPSSRSIHRHFQRGKAVRIVVDFHQIIDWSLYFVNRINFLSLETACRNVILRYSRRISTL